MRVSANVWEGVATDILPTPEALNARLIEGRPLRIKFGMDPTAPDLHLGHSVVLAQLRRFQESGHRVLLVVGDFTAMIGDPTGRSVTRAPLTPEQVAENAQTYVDQVSTLLLPEFTEVYRNSTWLGALSAREWIHLMYHSSLARMLEREDFRTRFQGGQSIALAELMYPLLQGYDSVHLRADIEVGGTDQRFNLLMGRQLQTAFGQTPQIVMTFPLLEGLDGTQKMSKSVGNHIGLQEAPIDMYGKIMSISDPLMWRYYTLLSACPQSVQEDWKAGIDLGQNPKEAKMVLARELVTRFHGMAAAQVAAQAFEMHCVQGQAPTTFPEVIVCAPEGCGATVPLGVILREAGLTTSSSQGHRVIAQGGVRLDGVLVTQADTGVAVGGSYMLQVGKRKYMRVTVRAAPS